MAGELLLVGSIPMDTAEQVFKTFGPALGRWLDYLPDGEVGERQYWVDGLAYRVLNGHRELETLRWPSPEKDGTENWKPRAIHDEFQFRVKPGISKVRFGDPGWRLGYTRDAVNSYAIFRYLKRDGVIPKHVRFQVCLPLTFSALGSFFPDRNDLARVIPGLNEALGAEIRKMAELIPPDDLAIQWDLAVENRFLEAMLAESTASAQAEAKRLLQPASEICPLIPEGVALGFHVCFGTLNGWPSRQPPSLKGSVLMANAAVAAAQRRVDFIHVPTVGNSDDDFFSPLKDLRIGDAKLYLGAIHHMHDAEGIQRQLRLTMRHFSGEIGLAAPCGFGRAPERPGRLLSADGSKPSGYIGVILKDHEAAVKILENERTG